MLTADAFAVLPPISRLTPSQAMYHFFLAIPPKSPAPKRPRQGPASDLFHLLRRALHAAPPERVRQPAQGTDRQGRGPVLAAQHRLDRRQVRRRLADADQGHRALLNAALEGKLDDVEYRKDANFGFDVPVSVPALAEKGIDQTILDPRSTWADKDEYDATAEKLVQAVVN